MTALQLLAAIAADLGVALSDIPEQDKRRALERIRFFLGGKR